MTASPRKAIKKISDRKLKSLGGKTPFSSISKRSESPRKRPRKKSGRERIYGPPGYVEWIHEQPCIACGVKGHTICAHTESGGTGRKADFKTIIPLCWVCHMQLHAVGRQTFEKVFDGIDLEKCAAETEQKWLDSLHTKET